MSNIIQVRVIPNAKKNEVKKDGGRFKVYVTAPPVKGEANKMLLKVLAEYFNCKKSRLKIIRGERTKDKIIQFEQLNR